jgi:hypothetical protein
MANDYERRMNDARMKESVSFSKKYFPAKAQRRKENWFLTLRLCAFAGTRFRAGFSRKDAKAQSKSRGLG